MHSEVAARWVTPEDIEVYTVEQALEVAEKGYLEFGPDSVK